MLDNWKGASKDGAETPSISDPRVENELVSSELPDGERGRTEIAEVPLEQAENMLLRMAHLEEQGKMVPLLGSSSGAIARYRRMDQVAAVKSGDKEKIARLEKQDENFRLENVARRRDPSEIHYELSGILNLNQALALTERAWFAAECLTRKLPEETCEIALEIIERAPRLTEGAAQYLSRGRSASLDAVSRLGRVDLVRRLAALQAREASR